MTEPRRNIPCTDAELVDWDLHYDQHGTLRGAGDEEIWGCVGQNACGRLWTGIQPAHCAGCHQQFSSDTAFDKHQRWSHVGCKHEMDLPCQGKIVCVAPDLVGLIAREDRFGPVWGRPGSHPGALIHSR